MVFRKLALIAMMAGVSGTALAQYENTTIDERIAATNNNNEDSIKVGRGYISLFQQSISNQSWADAYINWKWLMAHAPYAVNGIYTQGPLMFYYLINAEQDEAKKLAYFKELMELFEARQKNLDALNSFAKTKSTQGDVLASKAEYYNWTAPKIKDSGYTLNKSYENYKNAITMINEKGGREIEGSVLQNFFLISDAMYKAQPDAFRAYYLQDYLDSKDACEKMLQLAKEAQAAGDTATAAKLVAKYDGPLAFIEQTFTNSGAADREQIIAIFTKGLEAAKSDLGKLNSAINLMAANDCDDSDIYYQYAQAAYAIEPTYQSAIGCAQYAQQQGNTEESATYYDKALELASNDNVKGIICLRISKALAGTDVDKSNAYIEKAVGFNADLAGKAYLQQAVNMVHAGKYPEAIAFCDKAAESDITVAPSATRLKGNIQHAQSVNAENARKKAEYDAYKAKQKKEEDFWNQGATNK
ncbi:MAG: tetratricopeptide repeat protein [Prevotellaceae bacterium]|nr:tetratricopeptide repeat protein [Prevotellaceae bacterium]MDY6098774.1 tetratricopeptide repeat protein [Bacteroidaceae bacterium]